MRIESSQSSCQNGEARRMGPDGPRRLIQGKDRDGTHAKGCQPDDIDCQRSTLQIRRVGLSVRYQIAVAKACGMTDVCQGIGLIKVIKIRVVYCQPERGH